MRAKWLLQWFGIVAGAAVAVVAVQEPADAARYKPSGHSSHIRFVGHRSWHPSFARSGLQCVPFARENSGIELSGNAGTWWAGAEGLYERGARPEVGSILNFRATGRMRMGHVAVVTNVISPRHIEIDHANWGAPGRISRNIDVVDVSPANDWTAVRVALPQTEELGSTYPTYGFIYDRPDRGTMVANNGVVGTPPTTVVAEAEEVAEATDDDAGPRYAPRRHAGHVSRLHVGSRTHGTPPSPAAARTFRVSTAATKLTPHKHRHF